MSLKKHHIFYLFLLFNGVVSGQQDTLQIIKDKDSLAQNEVPPSVKTALKSPNGFKIIALPVAFYTPDTKIGGGVGGLTTFNFKGDSIGARRSSVTVGLVYTQLRQILLYFPFQLFPQNQKYRSEEHTSELQSPC